METATVNGVELEYEVTGSGEPVLLISPCWPTASCRSWQSRRSATLPADPLPQARLGRQHPHGGRP